MTATGATDPATDQPRSRKKLWLWCVAIAVVVAAVTVTLVLVISAAVNDEGYGPLESGPAFGTGGPGVRSNPRDGTDTVVPGRGPAYYFTLLDNAGTHAVRVIGVEEDSGIAGASWAPAAKADYAAFSTAAWRKFPATVPANGTIQVRLSVSPPPSCASGQLAREGVGLSFGGSYTVRWDSRRSRHETLIEGDPVVGALKLC